MNKEVILCVDDQSAILTSLKNQLLNFLGDEYEIILARSAAEALEFVRKFLEQEIEISLVISDHIMPQMNGDELLIQIHKLLPRTLKILLTGQASAEAVGNAVNYANLYRYITKPWEATDFCLTVKEALRRYAHEKQVENNHQNLQKLNAKLEQLNASLEERITERTIALTQTNARLQQEIFERQLLEQKLTTSEHKLRAVFESIHDIILIIDEQQQIEIAPTKAVSVYAENSNLLNLTVEKFFQEESGKIWLEKIQEVQEKQETIHFDYSVNLDDREVWFAASISPLPNRTLIWVAHDISDRKQAEAALEHAKEAAEAANRAKSDFLSKMSHELRTPLNVILGFTQLLDRDPTLSPTQREQLNIIGRSGNHLLQLINDVLEMSKIEAGAIAFNETIFDLYHLLDTLQEMMQFKAQSQGVSLIFQRASQLPQYVRTDERKLRQVLINLIENAIKFSKAGVVTLRVKAQPESLQLGNAPDQWSRAETQNRLFFELEDTGAGIAPEELDQIFHPFVQTQIGKMAREGTGLGLPISRQFVRLMGGDITVSSQVGVGTIFKWDIHVDLGAVTDIQAPFIRKRAIALAPNQPDQRVLIVDDSAESRQWLMQLLWGLGFSVQEAENGQEAVDLWKTWQPHLILMDMQMPIMDGYEATEKIKQDLSSQSTIILALTASVFESDRQEILAAGCDDLICKPFPEDILLEKIGHYLGVGYLYQDSKGEQFSRNAIAADESVPPALKDLQVMSPAWIEQLYQAAEAVDNEFVLQLIQEIPAAECGLINTLTDWVKNFRCDRILELIETWKQLTITES